MESKLIISSNKQKLTILEDSLDTQKDILSVANKKVNATQDQVYLIAGNINSFNNELQTNARTNKINKIKLILFLDL